MKIARLTTTLALLTVPAACDSAAPEPQTGTWVGFAQPSPVTLAVDSVEDNDTIWFQMVFEYATDGPYDGHEFRATLLVYEFLEEDDTDCDLEWLPEDDRSCRIIVVGSGLHTDRYATEHIHVGGLEIPTLGDPCAFAGEVYYPIWYADLRCGEEAKHELTVNFGARLGDGR